MGLYSVVRGVVRCPRCGVAEERDVQFKYGNLWAHEYRLGDSLVWGRTQVGEPHEGSVAVSGIAECACGFVDCDVIVRNDVVTAVRASDGTYDYVHSEENFVVIDEKSGRSMKVRQKPGTPPEPGLEPNAEHVVLGVEGLGGNHASYRLERDDGVPVLYPLEVFEVCDGTLPPSWAVRLVHGTLELGHRVTLAPGFWERFFDGDPAARAAFRAARDAAHGIHPEDPEAPWRHVVGSALLGVDEVVENDAARGVVLVFPGVDVRVEAREGSLDVGTDEHVDGVRRGARGAWSELVGGVLQAADVLRSSHGERVELTFVWPEAERVMQLVASESSVRLRELVTR